MCPLLTPQLLWGLVLALLLIFFSGYFFDQLNRKGFLSGRLATWLDLLVEGSVFFALTRVILNLDWPKVFVVLGIYALYGAYVLYSEARK
ncbi:MAG: hypothetical protein M1299_03545 [Firmicutes bacterium]|nr:hypothetical protein [Bacillota bacterium]MCL5038890.1 hypothetical protein [Bacillota bacterium]